MEHQEKLHQCVLFVCSFVTMTTALSQLSYHRMFKSSVAEDVVGHVERLCIQRNTPQKNC